MPGNKPISQAAIARDWSVSREYIRQCVAKGMPLTSYEDCRNWRKAHTSKRPTTNPRQIARLLTDEAESVRAEMPVPDSIKRDLPNKPKGTRLPGGDTLNEGLNKAIEANEEAFRLLKEAMMEEKDQKIGVRLGYFNKSNENLFKAETAYRTELERRSVLIEMAKAQDWARKAFEIILSRLSAMPQNLAVRLNPENPHLAVSLLEEEVATIIADGRRAIA